MRPADLAAWAAAFAVSAWSAFRLSRASAPDFLDRPNERSLHSVPVPRTGGLAVLAGLAAGSVVLAAAGHRIPVGTSSVAWLAAAAFALAVVSFLDDWKGVSPVIRLGIHLAACAAAVLALEPNGVRPGALTASLTLTLTLRVVALAWFVNLYNFMDGMDGLAGSMTVVGCGFLAVGAARAGDVSLLVASLAVAAAAGGFLVFNLPPARIFLGDVGSITLGFLCGVLSLFGASRGDFQPWFPLLVFSPFLFDATFTLARRLLRGELPWRAHREHLYQRLVLAGRPHRKVLAWGVASMIAAGSAALWLGARR